MYFLVTGGSFVKVHVLQHVPFESVGSIGPWLSARDANISFTRFFESSALPEPRGLDLIIVMGGPMSVNDEAVLPWLKPEKLFLRKAIEHELPVVGICLGAQLIASALGARVYVNAAKEIGWFEIDATPGMHDVFHFPEKTMVFHWHGDTFDLPSGSVRLAKSVGCANQAFQVGKKVIGLQFHLETTPEDADSIINNCRGELVEGRYIQSELHMRAVPPAAYAQINSLMGDVLSYVTRFTPR